MRTCVLLAVALLLISCGGPSPDQIQATVASAVQATITANTSATASAVASAEAARCAPAGLSTYATTVEEQVRTFEMQSGLTSSTPRASMGAALQRLLDIQTETRRMEVAPCLTAFHAEVVSMMGLYRLAYETFAAQGSEAITTVSLRQGDEALANIKQGLATLRAGTIPVLPTPSP